MNNNDNIWNIEKGKTSKFVDVGGYSRDERGRGIGDLDWVDKKG